MDSYWRGILQRKSPRARPDGFVDEALNVAFVGGIPISRPGLRPFHGAAFAAPIRGLGFHVSEDGVPILLAAAGTVVQSCVQGGDPQTLPLTNLPVAAQTRTTPERASFLSLSGGRATTIIYDGENANLKYQAGLLSGFGVPTPPTPHTPTDLTGVGTIPRGKRFLLQTLVAGGSLHEGAPTELEQALSVELLTPNHQYTIPTPVQGVDYDDPQVSQWRLYSTTAGGGTFFFVDEADIGVDIVVNISDELLGKRTPVEQFVNDPPPGPAVAMTEHRGQVAAVFADDRSLIRFSFIDPDYSTPESWPEDYVQPVSHGDGDRLCALASMTEWLVAFKENGTYAVVGETFEEYKVVPVLAAGGGHHIGIGCIAPAAVMQVENALMFASRDGIYRIERFASAVGGIQAARLSGAIDDLYAAVKFSLGGTCFFDRKHRVFVWLGHG